MHGYPTPLPKRNGACSEGTEQKGFRILQKELGKPSFSLALGLRWWRRDLVEGEGQGRRERRGWESQPPTTARYLVLAHLDIYLSHVKSVCMEMHIHNYTWITFSLLDY